MIEIVIVVIVGVIEIRIVIVIVIVIRHGAIRVVIIRDNKDYNRDHNRDRNKPPYQGNNPSHHHGGQSRPSGGAPAATNTGNTQHAGNNRNTSHQSRDGNRDNRDHRPHNAHLAAVPEEQGQAAVETPARSPSRVDQDRVRVIARAVLTMLSRKTLGGASQEARPTELRIKIVRCIFPL